MPGLKRSAHPSLALRRLQAGDLMNRNVVCVRPELSLDALCLLFLETGLKAVPVVNAAGRVQGMVSETDLQLEVHTRAAKEPSRTVADAMLAVRLTIPDYASIREAAGLLAQHDVERLPVVAADGEVVGVLERTDILRWLASEGQP